MTPTTLSDVGTAEAADLSPKACTVAEQLRVRIANTDGDCYVKSRFLAEELALSAQEIGAALAALSQRESVGDLVVEKWAYSSATTWRISLRD